MTKRLISLFLCVGLLLSVLPAFSVASSATDTSEEAVDAAFAAIDAALAKAETRHSNLTDAEKTEIAKAAVENLGYETNARGDGCFTFVADGEPCIYNCRTYELLSQMTPIEGYVDDGEVVTVDYSKRATGPNSQDVVLIEPFYGLDSSFTKQYQTECSSIAKATGGTYTLYKTSAATIDAVADGLENAAVVVFDSHGDTDYYETPDRGDYTSQANTSYLLLSTGTGITSADKSKATGEFDTYYHTMSSSGYYYVDGTAITNHMEKSAPNNLVWMAICLGMATDGMEAPLRAHGVGVVYGYSQSVTFDGDYDYEETFWTNMKNGKDVKTAVAAMKSKHGNWDPGMNCSSLSSAKKNYAAFPIVVSDLDAYPGHGNVDAYQTVNSDWTLFETPTTYTITAKSADESKGTVSLSGNTITATPNTGYRVSGYSVSPSNACTVKQNGNVFTVSDLTADCTVTVTFAEREKASLYFSMPDGVTCETISAYSGDTITLPKPSGTPEANKYTYSFVGWTTGTVNDTTQKPTVYSAGTTFSLQKDTILYALFSYMATEAGEELSFTKVTEAKTDYTGYYVIGSEEKVFLKADEAVSGTAIGSTNAAVSVEDTQITVEGQELYNVSEDLIFRFADCGKGNGSFTIRMKSGENYLMHSLIGSSFTTTDDSTKDGTAWSVVFTGTTSKLKNNSTKKYLQYNTTNDYFRCFADGAYDHVSLYYCADAVTYFTTELQMACQHVWSEAVTVLPATCTASGTEKKTCTLCGKEKTEAIPALGHDYIEHEAKPVTCVASGWDTYQTCSRCDYTTYAEQSALGHNFVDGVCTRCGENDPDYEEPTPVDPCEGYTDIDREAWYHTAVDFVLQQDLMGSTKTDILTFEPNTKVSRAIVASILYRMAGSPEVIFKGTFDDVKYGKWYTSAIEWCAQNSLASGKGDGKFDPNGNVTRQELAIFMKKMAEYLKKDTSATAELGTFADADKVPSWAKSYVSWAVSAGLISGKSSGGNTYLAPTDTATRAEFASILMRFVQNIAGA